MPTFQLPHPREGYADVYDLVVQCFREALSPTVRQEKMARGPHPDWLLTFSVDDIDRLQMAVGRQLLPDAAELAFELAEGLAEIGHRPALWDRNSVLGFYDDLEWAMLNALQATGRAFPIDLATLPNWRLPASRTAAPLLFDIMPEEDGKVDSGTWWHSVVGIAKSVVPQPEIDAHVEARAASLDAEERSRLADAHAVVRMIMMFFRSAADISLLARSKAENVAASGPRRKRTHGAVRDEIFDFILRFSMKMFGFPMLDTRLPGVDHDVRGGPAVRFLEALKFAVRERLAVVPEAQGGEAITCLRKLVGGRINSWATYFEQARQRQPGYRR